MFTPEERERIREDILALAREDARIGGAALTGSVTIGAEDIWSDIDLAFGVRPGSEGVVDDFTRRMIDVWGAVHTLDVTSGSWLYRVFLLPSTLQVDLAFAPLAEFGAKAPTFKLVFGESVELPIVGSGDAESMCGWAWLYALHVRSALARRELWKAEYMLSAMRDQTLALACLRFGLPTKEARGFDRLPPETLEAMQRAVPTQIAEQELSRVFRITTNALQNEIAHVSAELAAKVNPVLDALSA